MGTQTPVFTRAPFLTIRPSAYSESIVTIPKLGQVAYLIIGCLKPLQCVSTGMHVSICKSGYQACEHQNLGNQFYLRVLVYRLRCCLFSFLLGSPGTIALEDSDIPRDAARQAEFAKQQAEVMAQQAELIARLQQQTGASAFHQAPPPPRVPILGETANVQEDTDIPTGPPPPPILPQLSKAPTPTNLSDSPFEFETDPTALKVSKLEKWFKKSQGAHSIPDIEDGYTDSAVTLLDRFKMPHIDRFDGSGDPMVHLRLFSDILRPMGLTRLQKLSLFGKDLVGCNGHLVCQVGRFC
ncbi:hypothetical protein ACSBR2_039427 [Camellia fascicularis]